MDPKTFAALPLPVNLLLFTAAAALVWVGGVKVTAYAKVIAERTGAEQAFIGVLLLGAVVSLPENGHRRRRGDLVTHGRAAGVILAAGFILSVTADALADPTGLGTSFVGMLLGGVATSLPEVTTTVAAVRLAQYEMAFADAFGTNLFSVMRLFVADLAYARGPILNEVDRFSLFATLLGILLTGVYLAGLIERRHKAVFAMGIDSLIVLIAYAGGLVVLFAIR